MPQYLAPGVYVEEVPSAIRPIAGVGTSTAGFIGQVAEDVATPLRPGVDPLRAPKADEVGAGGKLKDGVDLHKTRASHPDDFFALAPAATPQLVTSWESFRNGFGDLQDGNRVLGQAVYGFFNNGGTRCWVTRYASAQSRPLALRDAREGLDAFKAIDEIALVAIPGATGDEVQTAILDHCESPFLQDRFAILDGRQTTTLTKAGIQGEVRDSSYGAIYYPWIDVGDKDAAGAAAYVPPSGHVAGIYARVDAERGVHKAPANEVIRGALGVQALLSREDQAGLNPDDINVIRKFDGNITVWGAHTLAGKENAEWRYVNVRRLFNFMRESIDDGTKWVVFEPNSPDLWSKIRRNVGAFLTTVWSSGALFGATPEQAFYVRCDETTNPAEVRDLGQVVTEIGVAVVKPAEFVVFRISQWAGAGASA
jgi:phage tail sheath protein FI